MLDEWTVNEGLITATMKTKRDIIANRFASEIERLYESHVRSDSMRP
jgi:long-subunit acyl-CoA synthetase (AMP-forming)